MKARLYRSWWFAMLLVLVLAAAPVTFGPEAPLAARTRPPALAGTWYPDGRARLLSTAHLLMRLTSSDPGLPDKPVALVVPHAGWNYSGAAAATAYGRLGRHDYDRVVVVAPSHHGRFRGYALDDAAAYRTPLGEMPLCKGVTQALAGRHARVVPDVTEPEHAVEIELPFLQASLDSFCLVPILVGETDAGDERAFAEGLATLDDGRTLFVFSSDFTHYGPRFGYAPFGALSPETREKIRKMDGRAIELLSAGNARRFRAYLKETGNTICGRHGLGTMLELVPRIAPQARSVLLAHYASFDLPGMQDENSVTYVTMVFLRGPEAPPPGTPLVALPRLKAASLDAPPVSPEVGDALVRLARAALETQLAGGDALEEALAGWPTGPEHELSRGVFVTLYRLDPAEIRQHGRLRGCIGEVDPRFPLYHGTVLAAVNAALNDPRFEPVTAFELRRLEVEVTVLSPRRPVESWRDIEIGTHGIVLEKGDRGAIFLPQVAVEAGWTLPETLTALSKKAGLPDDGWKEGARFSVFTGQVFGED